jgi:UDP-N-acetylglucosamine:LPS N-acetylglucosamine transferase
MMLVSSAGGHLEQLLRLRPTWDGWDRVWVTLDKPDARARLVGERVVWAHGPTNRSLGNLLRNGALAARVLRAERPDVVLSNGAGVAPPFFWVAAAMGIPTVFLEVVDRIERPSLAGRLVRPVASAIVLTKTSQRAFYPDGVVLGPLA